MKIALCFRGIPRSLSLTISSIEKNIIVPANCFGEVKIFTHFFSQTSINNPRTGEQGLLNPNEHELLKSDWLSIEKPYLCLNHYDFEFIKSFGDPWNDKFYSLSNLIHQLHSLKVGWKAAKEWGPDIVLFLRPDIFYHDSFEPAFRNILKSKRKALYVPYWQGWSGCNDRFAISSDQQYSSIYAERIDSAVEYCRSTRNQFHSESFLLHQSKNHNLRLKFIGVKATRIRSNGNSVNENFSVLRKSNFNAFGYSLMSSLSRG